MKSILESPNHDDSGSAMSQCFRSRRLTVDISPVLPTLLGSGSKYYVDPGEESIEIGFFWLLGESDDHQLLFVSVDALFPGGEIRDWIVDELGDLLEDRQIFITASHTHNAPMLDRDKPLLNKVIDEHLRRVRQTVIDGLRKLRNLAPVEVSFSVNEFSFPRTVSRRKKAPVKFGKRGLEVNKVVFGPQKLDSPSIGSSVVFNDGHLDIAALVIFDCHPVSHHLPNSVSPHYVGHLRSAFRNRKTSERDGVFIFMQGASGEIRPDSFRRLPRLFARIMNLFGIGPRFRSFSPEEYTNWNDELKAFFLGSLDSARPLQSDSKIRSARSTLSLSEFYSSESVASPSISISVVSTSFMEIIGISAEVTREFESEFFLSHPNRDDTVLRRLVGCTDHTYGYLCSSQQMREGGYEATGWMPYFSIKPNKALAKVPERAIALTNQIVAEARGKI